MLYNGYSYHILSSLNL